MRKAIGIYAQALLLFLAAACAPDAVTRPPPLGESLGAVGQGRQSYIVQLVPTADPPVIAAALMRQYGGELRHVYRHALKGFAAELSPQAADALLNNPMVEMIEQDGTAILHDTQLSPPWGLDRSDQRALPLDNSYTYPNAGAGVNAYIIDTGIRTTHSEFGGRASWAADFTGEGFVDCHGHGTHVSGTVGGTTYGIAKAVTLRAVKVFGCSGSAEWSTIIAAVDYVAGNRVLPAVANMSLGGGYSQAINDAVTGAIALGVSFSISAGNSNSDACNTSPAATPEAVTVGATASTDFRASFSSWGGCLDLFAPGVDVLSSYNCSDNCTASLSGTSMSAPHVSGGLALYLSANPAASPQQARDAVVNAATVGVVIGAGSGSPNRLLFVDWASNPPPPPPPPAPDAAFTIQCDANAFCTFQSATFQDGNWCFSDWERFGSGGCFGQGATYTRAMSTHDPVTGRSPYTTTVTHKVVGAIDVVHQVSCNRKLKCRQSN